MRNAIFLGISAAFAHAKNLNSDLTCLVIDGQV